MFLWQGGRWVFCGRGFTQQRGLHPPRRSATALLRATARAVKELNRAILTNYGLQPPAENARRPRVPPGGAGAPAHASCRKDSIFDFFMLPTDGIFAGDPKASSKRTPQAKAIVSDETN